MRGFRKCSFCGSRRHDEAGCSKLDQAARKVDPADLDKIWSKLQNNPYYREEEARRRASRSLGNDPDRKLTWRERRRRDGKGR